LSAATGSALAFPLGGTLNARRRYAVEGQSSTLLAPLLTRHHQGQWVALVLAHDRAVATFQTVYSALLAQFALLALMVLYTVGGLWLLSQG
jgi:hypothetical protein